MDRMRTEWKKRECQICEILFSRSPKRKYCPDCVEKYGRFIYNIWHRRAYQKRVGKKPDSITYASMIKNKEMKKYIWKDHATR